jgi:predicted acylesterase/phospholipase RssA
MAVPLTDERPPYPHPPYCDLIMKGGITSGVVYPLAISELAKQYKFKNIGGASAGAIAAAGTAAAEYGRRNGLPDTFKTLSDVATNIASDGRLLSLFQPTDKARPAFDVITATLGAKGTWPMFVAAARSMSASFPTSVSIGLGGAILVPVLLLLLGATTMGESLLLGILWGICGAAWLVYRFASTLLSAFAEKYFGFCTCFSHSPGGRPPLTNWLCDLLNKLAGKPANEPLTFGDLWTAPQVNDPIQTTKTIDLQLMTTNLTHGRPYTLPFPPRLVIKNGEMSELDKPTFYFDKNRWADLFPKEVVDWMVAKQIPFEPVGSTTTTDATSTVTAPNVVRMPGEDLIPLPKMADLPVIVAARMSLSFPGLIAPIPLHTVDYSLQENQAKAANGEPVKAEICWFSDGGISSNFPIHLFDSPLPRWPTFGINLKPKHVEDQKEEDDVWLPDKNSEGFQEQWSRFDAGKTNKDRFVGFAFAILNVLQNWRDNTQMTVPGFRDRIVHISLGANEGGLNLNMDKTMIDLLTKRGQRAGELLLTQFDFDNHAWVRYRSTMASLEAFLTMFQTSFNEPLAEDKPVWDVIKAEPGSKPPSYGWPNLTRRGFAKTATGDLASLIKAWDNESPFAFTDGAPRPQPNLRITPHV